MDRFLDETPRETPFNAISGRRRRLSDLLNELDNILTMFQACMRSDELR
jgi:hypothetical protein